MQFFVNLCVCVCVCVVATISDSDWMLDYSDDLLCCVRRTRILLISFFLSQSICVCVCVCVCEVCEVCEVYTFRFSQLHVWAVGATIDPGFEGLAPLCDDTRRTQTECGSVC